MAIAEIIHKKWVEPILADNYNRGRVEGLAEGRVEGVSKAELKGWPRARNWEAWCPMPQEWEAWLTRRDLPWPKASLLTNRRRADGVRWQNAGRQYRDGGAAQTVAVFRDIATGRAVIALVATPFVAYTGRE